jgi:NAD(P)-dependent dehydrogenase (short-subunit alcohol dehydrogenase family)
MSGWDLTGQTVVLTGGTSGVGRGTARGLARRGASLVLCSHSAAGGEIAKEALLSEVSGASIEVVGCDLSSQRSVRNAASEILARRPSIRVLANIAGLLPPARTTSVDGVELTWATNFLGPFLLTSLLTERLVRSAPARIVNISGNAHRRATLDLDDPELSRGWSVWRASTQTALAKVVWTYALADALEGTGVTANTFCPGFVKSRLTRSLPLYARPFASIAMRFAMSEDEGAMTPIHLATSPELEGVTGIYVREMHRERSADVTYDRDVQARLVALAERMTAPL